MQKFNYVFISILLFFSGCVSSTPPVKSEHSTVPQWIKPNSILQKYGNGKRVSVGCAYIHKDGVNAQKNLALRRAIDQIAIQKNTKVSTTTYIQKNSTNGNKTSTNMQTSSLHSVNNTSVSVDAKEWYTKSDGDICVLAVER